MELIKKKIKLNYITGSTSGTTGKYVVLIPNTKINYNLNILLTNDSKYIGFLNAFVPTVAHYYYAYNSDGGMTPPIGLNNLL